MSVTLLGRSSPVELVVPLATEHGQTVFQIRPGVVDAEARELYQWGYCHLLACAIHETTGWSFGSVEGTTRPAGRWRWIHMGVFTPSGAFLDVVGARPVAALSTTLAFRPDPMRVQHLSTFADFCRTVGLAVDTPLSWWHSQLGEVGTRVTRTFAEHLLAALPAAEFGEVAA
ncbi:hypothetical protein [Amycolatopsis cihanbeyliensis]|uniref:Uncharacterized protein n=1 Tax=Amycolatopsis cihanbeyliensis TaxID=1128664 RepID=A0A542DK04_AMYCI|nr:hypothetical protein [Amycolatopsis cihanbeyliensis]TQJ03265.1 hypothetical protein FB471_3020 [Amycolatopsis cihanbeyliensis]